MGKDENLVKMLEMVMEIANEVKEIKNRIENPDEGGKILRRENEKLKEEMLMMKKEIGRQNIVIQVMS